jgi:amino acid adenylation domain-containing protein
MIVYQGSRFVVNPSLYIPDLIEAQAEIRPEAIALICDDDKLTYRELNQRANQFARHLRDMGVANNSLVGICTSRSVEMVVGILAIFKAGGAYVPLDPAIPADRLSFILSDAQVQIVVTQNEHAGLFAKMGVQVARLDSDGDLVDGLPIGVLVNPALPESTAVVLYTSGSTGQPKGVILTHENLSHFVRLASLAHEVTVDDVYLQSAPIVYVVSIRQLLIPLTRGARVVIANSEQMHNPLMLFELIKREAVTLMDVIPSFWRVCIQHLAELPENERCELLDNSLRRIVSVGDALHADIPFEWRFGLGHKAQLMNNFGQTETTGMLATYEIPASIQSGDGIVPIGSPIPETRIYVLDSEHMVVPTGEPGELYISSPCLAPGYLNRPELTADKFIPNPFNDGLSSRLYRTGDLGRMRDDGNVEFVGRTDHQVKIRGQRLELGEVESVLLRHEYVRECAVMARGDQADEKYLAAYIVASAKSLQPSDLRQFVRNVLPDYMVPSAFVFLDEMPLTPNGKLDRLALPDPTSVAPIVSDPSRQTEPRNHFERTVKEIWKDLLRLDEVGIHDSFFDVGGHSMLSVRMFARIERDLGVRLPYTSLFHATTIAQIAELVAHANEDITRWRIVVPVQPRGNKPPFFGVHAHEGGVLFWRDIVSFLPKDQPFYALQARGVDGLATPLNRVPDMARLYIQEIRKVQPHGPYFIGGYSLGGEVAFEMGQQLVREGEKVDLLVMLDTRNPTRTIRPMVRVDGHSLAAELDAPPPADSRSVIKQKLAGHFLRLSTLSTNEKVEYILNQISVRLNGLVVSVSVKIFQMLRRRLPNRILLLYLRKRHREALVNYVPAVYPGKITLFRASESLATNPDDSLLGWAPLAAGGMEIYHFEASHAIVYGECAKEVAETLNDCLKKARAE